MVKALQTLHSAKTRHSGASVRYVSNEDFSKTIASIRKMSSAEVVQSLKEAGILTRSGKLAAGYRQA
jgi:hypothetical protein